LAVVGNLSTLAAVVPALVRSISPQIRDMFADNAWRVRQSLIRTLPQLLQQLVRALITLICALSQCSLFSFISGYGILL
jgi:hypothetical protein